MIEYFEWNIARHTKAINQITYAVVVLHNLRELSTIIIFKCEVYLKRSDSVSRFDAFDRLIVSSTVIIGALLMLITFAINCNTCRNLWLILNK